MQSWAMKRFDHRGRRDDRMAGRQDEKEERQTATRSIGWHLAKIVFHVSLFMKHP